MDSAQCIAERKIREAQEQGAFDNLVRAHQPVNLAIDPFEDPEMRIAHKVLRNNHMVPHWVEERRELRDDVEVFRNELRSLSGDTTRAINCAHRARAAELNRRIRAYNLKAPLRQLHLAAVSLD